MNKEEHHIDRLIARYLSGEALPDEAIELDQWRATSPENERYFADAYTLYHGAGQSQPVFNSHEAWQKVGSTLEPESEKGVVSLHPKRPSGWKIAAGIALIAALGAAILYFVRPGAVTSEFASGPSIFSDTLFTGSAIILNSHSHLNYHYDKSKQVESIELSGEAFFDLKAPKGVTTEVEAQGLTIRDIGTSFHVSAYPHNDTVLVWVETGEVAISTAQNQGIAIGPGEGGLYIKSSGIIKAHTPTLLPNWHQTVKEFHFNKASLGEVATALNARNELKIEVAEHLRNCRITVIFIDESALSMATIISETIGLSLEQKGDTIYLSGDGCPR